ncbi:hypothetical protein TWF281_000969 [Arthrobotrys megalospora]
MAGGDGSFDVGDLGYEADKGEDEDGEDDEEEDDDGEATPGPSGGNARGSTTPEPPAPVAF